MHREQNNTYFIELALLNSKMKHTAAALLFVFPCVSSFTNRIPSSRRQPLPVPPLSARAHQMHDRSLVKLDDPITSATEEASSYMPYDRLPPSVSTMLTAFYSFELNWHVMYSLAHLFFPQDNWVANSTRRLSRIDLQKAMTKVKRFVESRLESDLNLFEVSNTKKLTLSFACH